MGFLRRAPFHSLVMRMCGGIIGDLEYSRLQGFGDLLSGWPVEHAKTNGKERTFDLMISSTGVFDWLAMLEKCRRKTLLSGARIMGFK